VVLTLELGEELYSLHDMKKQSEAVADFIRQVDFFALEDHVRRDSSGSLAKKILVGCECEDWIIRCTPGQEIVLWDKPHWLR
jgi:hypothetical protein